MKKFIIKLLAGLVYRANSTSQDPAFFAIKRILLTRFGVPVGITIQSIPGKPCWDCGGEGGVFCRSMYCDGSGWYKKPFWTILIRYQFGSYTFHLPIKRVESKEEVEKLMVLRPSLLTGYVQHDRVLYGEVSVRILLLLFDLPKFLKGYWRPGALISGAYYKVTRFIHRMVTPIGKEFRQVPSFEQSDLPF